eukprot:UN18278
MPRHFLFLHARPRATFTVNE